MLNKKCDFKITTGWCVRRFAKTVIHFSISSYKLREMIKKMQLVSKNLKRSLSIMQLSFVFCTKITSG